MLKHKDILGLLQLSAEEIDEILTVGEQMKERLKRGDKYLTDLKGRSVTTLFYENSTRTRCSFELAAKNLGANVVNISAAASSVKKGETLVDTGKTLGAHETRRHRDPSSDGRCASAARRKRTSARSQRRGRHERTPVAGAS